MLDAVRVRRTVGSLFVALLVVNTALLTLAAAWAIKKEQTFEILPSDVSLLLRLLALAFGAALSWFVGRTLYFFLVKREVRADTEGVSIAYAMMFYFLLLLLTLIYLGWVSWMWFPILLIVVVIYSVIVLWSFVGPAWVFGGLALAAVAGGLIWFYAA